MKKRMFLYTALILFSGLIIFFAVSVYTAYANNLTLAKDTVMETTRIFADLYSGGAEVSALVKAGKNTRVTVIAPDGTILADSAPLDMNALDNHLNRPEIQAAENGFPEAHIRRSETLGADMIYYALKSERDGGYAFIRTAIPVAKIDGYLFQSLPPLVFLLLIIAFLCFLSARGIINRVAKPFASVEKNLRLLSEGKFTTETVDGSYEEIDKITRNINEIALILQNGFAELRDEKNKLDYILNNIGDGLFAVDENKNVAMINSAALGIFNASAEVTGKNLNYLTYDKILAGAAEECAAHGKNAMFEHTVGGRVYFASVKRLPDTRLTMIILSDITESRENAKRREEFFADASHELKTPLTAIKGFNELTAINNKDENIKKYIDGITRETNRMLTLIGDMLRLSELENAREVNPVPVSLAKVADEAREALSAAINEKSINFETFGDAVIMAEPEHIYELVKNLAENAVRYNNQGGRVSVTVGSDKKNSRILVRDDGVGISPKEQSRIFERFYRVEKSRSQRNGGTGLGLSIVKHICGLYGWELSLKSRLGAGTEITVVFPAKD